ncbi:L-fucose:H+ symporter permease [Thalassotalea piscium]|uniref:FHS family L-fucose permease-like MFS transporter n=2 Tax=Thalassotalea piscium TaxID=1230533 RepID=A0A7X0NG77_9GAMM|nr:L-fucose:H+ symporter permease [Thalassotalea piscium]MBB6542892.1 FHS family L-fucose permease-like MFS transporter [Thalassotalea piscium]
MNKHQDSDVLNDDKTRHSLLAPGMLIPFLMITALFPLWGFANDVTNPLVKAFKDIFLISNAQSSMVQFAFYLGYGIMAIPAAIFIRNYSYKAGILLGLALYAAGAMLFIPASLYMEFNFFLAALCILTCGLALLETTANPYILSMGHPSTATKRLNLAQAFNPIGSLTGMFVASTLILNKLQVEEFRAAEKLAHPEYNDLLPSVVDGKLTQAIQEFSVNEPIKHQAMQAADLVTVRGPYIAIATIVTVLFFVFLFYKLPKTMSNNKPLTLAELKVTFMRLIKNKLYIEGVVAQAFYVGAQIMCWTFIIHYGMTVVGLTSSQAQNYNIIAMSVFLVSRFICTFLLSYIKPGHLLMLLATCGGGLILGTIFLTGFYGLYCLIGVSACMSLMFPTIYGIALKDMGDDASLASAGLVMAIVGGALMPPLQASLIDDNPLIASIPSVQTSFLMPLICFVVIAIFGYRSHYVHKS